MLVYKLPGKLVRESDSAVILNGPFYVCSPERTDSNVLLQERDYFDVCNSIVTTPLKCTRFGPNGDNPLDPPYSNESPTSRLFMKAYPGYLNTKILSPLDNETRIYRLYPNRDDEHFYIRISIRKDQSTTQLPEYFRIFFDFVRDGVSIFNFGTSDYETALTQLINNRLRCLCTYLPWIGFDSNNNLRLSYCTYTGTCEYPRSGDEPTIISSSFQIFPNRSITLEQWNSWAAGFNPDAVDADNPYWDGGTSDIGGGDGNFSEDSDTPETDTMPQIGAVGTGFATIFKPSISQLRDLSGLFWNSNVFTFLQNLVENITNMFTSLAMVPFEVDAGRQVSVTWLGIDTAVTLTLAARQYYEFDMGSIDMANDSRIFTSGSVLDYSPFSKLGIYLPFIGYQELDIDECRDAVINLRYRIDILSGACVAILKVGGRDLYQFSGNCLTQIPITNESMQSLVSDAVNVGIAAAGVGATGASVGADLAEAASSKSGIEYGDIANAHRAINRSESGLASASANAVIGSKPTFNKSGAISSSASMMAVKQPFLFLSTPRQSIPEHYQRYKGFPSNITSRLGDLSGFTVVEDIRLNGLVATSPEVAEIYDLLKKGVII